MKPIVSKRYKGPQFRGQVTDDAVLKMPDSYRASFLQRVGKYIIRAEGHWLWKGCFNGKYPIIGVSHAEFRGQVVVHRALYVIKYGAPEPGLEIDHVCRVTYCVKPTHLEAVTPEVNRERYRAHPDAVLDYEKLYARKNGCTLEQARRRNENEPELEALLATINVDV